MSGAPDRHRAAVRPFLISRDDGVEGRGYRLTVRETRYNGQGYPIVGVTRLAETFASPAAARTFARERFGAASGDFAMK